MSEHNGAGLAANKGSLRPLSGFPHYLVCGFWLAWQRYQDWQQTTGSPRSIISSSFELDTGSGWESIPLRSPLSRVSLSFDSVVVGEEDELEEDVG